ncbi:type IV CRISPR-associated protein Csf1 [Paracidovorax wautersii]|uniref:CRISPR type AFERR-associated protein Csf1 n=1 Tax=Paracidovorax wautersii TaxID=1177982 RepID=A0A1I2HU16_9BURK|nr:type IV CRISPR-associated protein Csf1 [Paracidovorax wautersii]SFF33128.1 CRISPR type AFERR-associated protein Csf1 [Paracidovorax wautersii]
MNRLTASDLACQALNVRPQGEPHRHGSTTCSFCGKAIHDGDPSAPFEPAKTFTDTLKTFPSGVICGACATVTSSQVMLRNFQRVVITNNGLYPIGTDANRAWLWMTPPEPPFVVVINHSTMGAYHYVWRTPVSMSKQLICANVDDTLMWIDQPALIEAVNVCRELEMLMKQIGMKKAQVWKSPSREGLGGGHGLLSAAVHDLAARSPQVQPKIDFLATLDAGVLVALASIIKSKPVDPVKPEPIVSFAE